MHKKLLVVLLVVLSTMMSIVAMEKTYTIILVSVVDRVQPQFAIRNAETGAIGQSVVYNTSKIADADVRTSFDIIQTNDSNYRGTVHMDITASELVSYDNGTEYRTKGVMILANGIENAAKVCFNYELTRNTKAESVVSTFDVIWTTNENLINANYQAVVTISYSAS